MWRWVRPWLWRALRTMWQPLRILVIVVVMYKDLVMDYFIRQKTISGLILDGSLLPSASSLTSYRPEVAVPDIRQIKLQTGDRVLLCSDGLYKSMAPDILQARMMDDKTLEEILDVYDYLCEKQGDDNYTAILIECF